MLQYNSCVWIFSRSKGRRVFKMQLHMKGNYSAALWGALLGITGFVCTSRLTVWKLFSQTVVDHLSVRPCSLCLSFLTRGGYWRKVKCSRCQDQTARGPWGLVSSTNRSTCSFSTICCWSPSAAQGKNGSSHLFWCRRTCFLSKLRILIEACCQWGQISGSQLMHTGHVANWRSGRPRPGLGKRLLSQTSGEPRGSWSPLHAQNHQYVSTWKTITSVVSWQRDAWMLLSLQNKNITAPGLI